MIAEKSLDIGTTIILILLVTLASCVVFSGLCGKPTDTLIKAAEQGDAEAQYNLGVAYVFGQSFPQGYVESVKWFRKAAEQGHAKASLNLGWMHANGNGVPQDYISAYMWYDIAESNGAIHSAGVLEDFAKKMTPDDIKEGKRRAQMCLESNYKQCD